MATFSRSLDYVGGLKRRAVSARSFRVIVNSKSGSTFSSGMSATVDLPVIPRTFGDLNNMYVMYDIKSSQATLANCGALGHSGYDVFNRITVSSGGGSVISDCQNVNRYYAAILQQQCGHEWHHGYAAEALGHRGDASPFGVTLPQSTGTAKTLCLPLLHGICTADKLLNLDSALPLSFTFYFEDYMNALINSVDSNAAADYSISNFRIVMNCTELAPEAMVILNEAVGDFGYAMNFTELQCVTDTKPASVSQHITNLGFRHSSLNKITLLQYDQSTSKLLSENNLTNRSYSDLNELCFHINGVKYPQNHIKGSSSNFSEFITETMLANGTLGDAGANNSFNYLEFASVTSAAPTGTSTEHTSAEIQDAINNAVNGHRTQLAVNIRNYEINKGKNANTAFSVASANRATLRKQGTFLVSYDFSSFKSPQDDSGLYSGISSLAGNIVAEMKYGSNADFALDLYFYSESDRILSIDPVSRTHEVTD